MNSPAGNNSNSSTSGFYFFALILLIILGSIERIHGIDRESLWTDELFAVMASYLPFSEAWHLMTHDSHPPGYVALMYYLIPWLGYSDFAIRAHSLVYGIVWIPLVYWIGRRWFSRETGLLAAAIIASSYSAIYFSQEARAYSMLVAFCLANLICFLEILFATKQHRGYTIGFIISSIIILYLHYTCFVFFAAEGLLYLILWLSKHRKGSFSEMAKIFGLPLLAYSPWMGLMVSHLTDTSLNWAVTAKPNANLAYSTFQELWGPNRNFFSTYLCVLAITIVFTIYHHIKNGMTRQCAITYTLIFLLIVPVLTFYIESVVWTPIFEKRYFLVTVPLIALIVATMLAKAINRLSSENWHKTLIIFAIIVISCISISMNIERGIYTKVTKDPIRQAVDVIKKDLGPDINSHKYAILVTHNAFEHYLKRAGVAYDQDWPFRRYLVPQHIGEVHKYIKQHPEINRIYYLAAKEVTSDRARNAIKIKYQRLGIVEFPFSGGEIDVLKYNPLSAPDDAQLSEVADLENSPLNNIIKEVAADIKNRDPKTYATIMTHDWIEDRLPLFKINVADDLQGRYYQSVPEYSFVADYIKRNPAIDTLYYFYLREDNTKNARLILEAEYQPVRAWSGPVTAGTLDVLKFNVRAKPASTLEIKKQLQDDPMSKAAVIVTKAIGSTNPQNYAVIMSHSWFEPYLRINGVHIDESWAMRIFGAEFQAPDIFAYLNQHSTVDNLYYLRLDEDHSGNRLVPLLLKYQLLSTDTIDSPLGKLEIYRFNTKNKVASDLRAFTSNLSQSSIYLAAESIAKQSGKSKPDQYKVMMTHPFFAIYLKQLDVALDNKWPERFYTSGQQANEVFKYMSAHPTSTDLYYMAFRSDESALAIEALQKRYRLISKNTFEGTAGKIDVWRLNSKDAL